MVASPNAARYAATRYGNHYQWGTVARDEGNPGPSHHNTESDMSIRMKVVFKQEQQTEGQEPYANVRLQEVVPPESPGNYNPYGVSSVSLSMQGSADAYVMDAEYDVTLTPAA